MVAVAGGAFDLFVDVAFVAGADLARRHQAFDVEAVGGFGGDPAGRGVGLPEVPHLLEVGHGVADAGSGEPVLDVFGDGARADRFTKRHVGVDNVFEDLAVAVAELLGWVCQGRVGQGWVGQGGRRPGLGRAWTCRGGAGFFVSRGAGHDRASRCSRMTKVFILP